MEKYYFNIKFERPDQYFYAFNLPVGFGLSFTSRTLDKCIEDIIENIKRRKLNEIYIKSETTYEERFWKGRSNVAKKEMEDIVKRLSEKCKGVKFNLEV